MEVVEPSRSLSIEMLISFRNFTMKSYKHHLFLLCMGVSSLAGTALAQGEIHDYEEYPSPRGVLIGVKGGVLLTSPRQVFPSVRVGESSLGTGEVSSTLSEVGVGNIIGLEMLFPFNEKLGLSLEFGSLTWVASYSGDSTRLPMRLDLQGFHGAIALEGNIYSDREAFADDGLRAIYVNAGIDVNVSNTNRLEASSFTDSIPIPQRAIGSFANNDPFRTHVSLKLAGGARLGLFTNLELQLEGSYRFALNPVFSSDVVNDNSFTVDNVGIQLGLGYRF